MLQVSFSNLESFIDWVTETNPAGEKYYCWNGRKLVAVVQSSRRRAILECEVDEKEWDKVSDTLEELGFRIVEEIKFPR